jgi:hypothetical protein
MPSGSVTTTASVPKRLVALACTPSLRRWPFQKSSEPGGTENDTVVTWPLPAFRLGQVGQPKNVIAVPADPT